MFGIVIERVGVYVATSTLTLSLTPTLFIGCRLSASRANWIQIQL